MTYAVYYRTGGTHRCEWRALFDTCQTDKQSLDNIERLERMGYKALRVKTEWFESIGLPIGWEPSSVNWDKDQIIYDKYATLHIKAA